MYKVLFVCHGNICRSPMAEFVMKELVRRAGRESQFVIDSKGDTAGFAIARHSLCTASGAADSAG